MKIQKGKLIKILIVVLIIILLTFVIVLLNKTGVMRIAVERIRNVMQGMEGEEIVQNAEYDIKQIEGEYLSILITFEDPRGIEKITMWDGTQIDGKGKTKIGLDRIVEEDDQYQVMVKYKEEEKSELYSMIPTTKPVINEIAFRKENSTLYETIEIEFPENENVTNYYSVGKNENWIEYTQNFEVELAIEQETNETEEKEIKTKSEFKTGKTIQRKNKTGYIANGNGLLYKVAYEITESQIYNIKVKEKTYSIHAYVYNEDTVLNENKVFGDAADAGTNMVVVKVNGNLTIEKGTISGVKDSTKGGPKGLFIYCTGTLTNNGTISMSQNGANSDGENVYLCKNSNKEYEYIPSSGASGGSGGKNISGSMAGKAGGNGIKRSCGGGGRRCNLCWRCVYI